LRRQLLTAACAGTISLTPGCTNTALARPQLLVIVDTNAPTAQQVASQDHLSPDAAIDTVRIDIISDRGTVEDYLDAVVPGPLDWPLSFGLAGAKSSVKLRIRGFRGRFASPGELNGKTTLEPLPEFAIDRLVQVELPPEGKRIVRITLDEDCIGRPPRFLAPETTCVDGDMLRGPPTAGVEEVTSDALHETQAGSWSGARYTPCSNSPPSDRVCIPGGFLAMGTEERTGLDPTEFAAVWPPHPVMLAPFRMDRTEFTVGRYKGLVASGAYNGAEPGTGPECSWLGAASTANDKMALSCVTWETARALCQAAGGDLPTEAQWEYAARGRGEGLRYPWGDEPPDCCVASLSRHSSSGVTVACAGTGPEPVAAHLPSASCSGLGDVSRDGVLDLGGGLTEFTLDNSEDYSADCWNTPGILRDPRCNVKGNKSRISRGGDWSSGAALAISVLRRLTIHNENGSYLGFRCVYAEGG
jgi:formylglycine-generating enzyme required for sulfatase activity